eukprot:CAMPEP_0113469292 /NCGR_PEP_ID=MMETSP0014_2-20120614/15819_1 /TAXON_ID=2857 /ORGANISM="Nitzschia sp." /LENGTH=580 /DNA_ID=CAMNT_0000361755 /DNA_START=1 /DNA_END=1739 /DNA_ORIENTATION=- /assembly_acc=CAM_ASM_000159
MIIVVIVGLGSMSIFSMLYLTKSLDKPAPNRNLRKISPSQATSHLQHVRDEFQRMYDNTVISSDDLFKKGLKTVGDHSTSIDYTAQRILAAAQEGRPFVMAFSGYSITVGRGNFFNQSFPFIVQRILEEPMQQVFGIPKLIVRNSAIGGIPSFPYGFCLEHFLGTDPDVISWDYSMNEGGKDSSVLEAWVRQATKQLPHRPMLILLDNNSQRFKLLEKYVSVGGGSGGSGNGSGWLHDVVTVGRKEILPGNDEKQIVNSAKPVPPGFQDWDKWGAPQKCPGKGSWHPKLQEHNMIGWMIAMHFIDAMERAVEIQQSPKRRIQFMDEYKLKLLSRPEYTQPVSPKIPENDPEVTDLLYGHRAYEGSYIMKDLSCRTSFQPAMDQSRTLPSIIVSGMSNGDLDIMVPRTEDHYKKGWILDVSKVERQTKQNVEKCGGLGYVDLKTSLYGVPESGKLRLWLPFEGPSHDHHGHHDVDSNAKHWFDDLIICEANEKRDPEACKLDQDMDVVVGGMSVTDKIHPIKGAGEYLKRTTCVNVGVPEGAILTKLGDVRGTDGRPLSVDEKKKFGQPSDDTVGLVVDIT